MTHSYTFLVNHVLNPNVGSTGFEEQCARISRAISQSDSSDSEGSFDYSSLWEGEGEEDSVSSVGSPSHNISKRHTFTISTSGVPDGVPN